MQTNLLVKTWNLATELFFVPLLFTISVINFLPNPLRYLMFKVIQASNRLLSPTMTKRSGRRGILMAVDETSHEAVDWALARLITQDKDYVSLLYIPEGDRVKEYRESMRLSNFDWSDKLPSADFIWEYCQKLDFAKVANA